jgi:hypothetical protein
LTQDLTKNDPHLLHIARLEYEYVQREKLQENMKLLEKEKELTAKAIQENEEKFDSLLPLLYNVLEATKPVQAFFGIDLSAKKEQLAVAQHLPPELYVLLVQSNGFKEATGISRFELVSDSDSMLVHSSEFIT